jgi:membrane protease YdiL (CAAX protease family)
MTLLANLAMLAIIIGAVVIGFGRVPPRDLGLTWRNIAIGGAALPAAWCAFAIAEAVMGITGSGFALNRSWRSAGGIEDAVGNLMGQVLGNAPYEELVFRAFLIPQIYLRWPNSSSVIRLVAAVAISQVFFGFAHVGTRLFKGHLDGLELFVSLLQVTVYGLAFSWIYLRTLNPFVVAAFHALSNYPEPIYYSARDLFPNETWLAYLLVAICFGALFPRLQRRAPSEPNGRKPQAG